MPTGSAGTIEGPLLRELGVGAAVSAVLGAAAWLAGRRARRSQLTAFGRQTMGWAAVDGVLVAGGRVAASRRSRRASDDGGDGGDLAARRTRLRRVLWANAVLDLGYVLGGAHLARDPRRRGDGVAIVVQGGFLHWLDTRHARRLAAGD